MCAHSEVAEGRRQPVWDGVGVARPCPSAGYRHSDKFPFVSVIVPTRNRAHLLRDCLDSLRPQQYPRENYEIIVVDDASTDDTAAAIHGMQAGDGPMIRYLRSPRRGPNAARNAGIEAAKGDPICFLDDDVLVPDNWLAQMVAGILRHPSAGAFGGAIRLRLERPHPRFCGREALVGEAEFNLGADEHRVKEVISANMAARRWAFEAVGLFDESLPIYGDEIEWQRRLAHAGIPVLYLPSAWLWHCRTASDLRPGKMMRRYLIKGKHYVTFARKVQAPASVGQALRNIPGYVAHAIRRRCFMGVLMAVRQLGVIWGLLERRTGPPHRE